MAAETPALDAAAADVTRADDQIGAPFEGGQEVRQVARVVREVGVHLEDQVVVPLEGPAEAIEIGAPEAELARPVHHVDPFVPLGDAVGEGAGAVRGGVVDHQDVRVREDLEDSVEEGRQIVSLVVGRGDDERLHSSSSMMFIAPSLHWQLASHRTV